MISDDDIEEALTFLTEHAHEAASARANRIYLEEYRHSLKAQIMKNYPVLPVNAQEREAYASQRYQDHLLAIQGAVYADEKARYLIKAAEAKIEAWRTIQATQRAMKV